MSYPLPAQLALDISLPDNASFANYYAGPNPEALRAVQDITEETGQFIYLWGKAGAGKTHLLHAACRRRAEQGAPPAYVDVMQTPPGAPEQLEGLEQLALVCIDNIHAIAGSLAWETALFHLYNRVRDCGARLLVAGLAPPGESGLGLPDLVSRLSAGLIFQLRGLDDAGKLAALQLRARGRGLDLPEDTGRFLLQRYPRDMHALFDLLQHLDHTSLSLQRKLTIPFVRRFIEMGDRLK